MRPDARAVAALALAEVAMHGASLREVLARHAGKLTDARDRALLTALAHHGSRWWLRYDAATACWRNRCATRSRPSTPCWCWAWCNWK